MKGTWMLVDVVVLVSDGEHLALINAVDSYGLEDLGLSEVANAGLGHDGDYDGALDLLDELRIERKGPGSCAC